MIDTSVFQGKRAAYYTLGCKLNFSETSTFAQMLQQMGVVTAGRGEQADMVALIWFALAALVLIFLRGADDG